MVELKKVNAKYASRKREVIMFYEAIAQFAKANAPSFNTPGYESYLYEAKDYFNMKSRVATNPKEITELTVIDDRTIRIIFRSQEVLNISQISRSLRVFSMYLIDETHPLNFSGLVSGKRLFRMTASEFANDTEDNTDLSDHDEVIEHPSTDENELVLLRKIIELMECSNNDGEAKQTVEKLEHIVDVFYENRRN